MSLKDYDNNIECVTMVAIILPIRSNKQEQILRRRFKNKKASKEKEQISNNDKVFFKNLTLPNDSKHLKNCQTTSQRFLSQSNYIIAGFHDFNKSQINYIKKNLALGQCSHLYQRCVKCIDNRVICVQFRYILNVLWYDLQKTIKKGQEKLRDRQLKCKF